MSQRRKEETVEKELWKVKDNWRSMLVKVEEEEKEEINFRSFHFQDATQQCVTLYNFNF
jgi:hypothetical protein